MLGEQEADLTFPSPTKEIVSPLVKAVLSKDKNVVKALSFGAPSSYTNALRHRHLLLRELSHEQGLEEGCRRWL